MLNFNQALLILVIVLLTGLLTFVGIQVILLLKELRRTIDRANQILDEVGLLIHKISNPSQSLENIITGIKQGVNLIEIIRDFFRQKKQESYVPEE